MVKFSFFAAEVVRTFWVGHFLARNIDDRHGLVADSEVAALCGDVGLSAFVPEPREGEF